VPKNKVEVCRRSGSAGFIIRSEYGGRSISETSADFYQTTLRNIPKDRNLFARRRENLKCHQFEFRIRA
jgi:hypothetical protein